MALTVGISPARFALQLCSPGIGGQVSEPEVNFSRICLPKAVSCWQSASSGRPAANSGSRLCAATAETVAMGWNPAFRHSLPSGQGCYQRHGCRRPLLGRSGHPLPCKSCQTVQSGLRCHGFKSRHCNQNEVTCAEWNGRCGKVLCGQIDGLHIRPGLSDRFCNTFRAAGGAKMSWNQSKENPP